jgi:hypothetical protein
MLDIAHLLEYMGSNGGISSIFPINRLSYKIPCFLQQARNFPADWLKQNASSHWTSKYNAI